MPPPPIVVHIDAVVVSSSAALAVSHVYAAERCGRVRGCARDDRPPRRGNVTAACAANLPTLTHPRDRRETYPQGPCVPSALSHCVDDAPGCGRLDTACIAVVARHGGGGGPVEIVQTSRESLDLPLVTPSLPSPPSTASRHVVRVMCTCHHVCACTDRTAPGHGSQSRCRHCRWQS